MERESFVAYCSKRLREFDPSNASWEGLVFSFAFDSWDRTAEANHLHFSPEIIFQISGTSELRTPLGSIIINPSEVFITPPGLPHTEYVKSGQFENLILLFWKGGLSFHIARGAGKRPSIIQSEFIDSAEVELFSRGFEMIMRRTLKTPGDGIAYDQFSVLLRLMIGEMKNFLPFEGAREHPKVYEAMRWARLQYDNPDLNVAGIADRMNCAPDYLSHLFVQETGQRLTEYITEMRIERSKKLMQQFPLHINEIARLSGFADSAYFTRVFKKKTGSTPKMFQQNFKKGVL